MEGALIDRTTSGSYMTVRDVHANKSTVRSTLRRLRQEGLATSPQVGCWQATDRLLNRSRALTSEEHIRRIRAEDKASATPRLTPGQWRDLNPDPHQENARKLFEEDQPRQRDGFKVVHYETMTEQDRKCQDIFPYVDRLNSIDQHIRTLEAERLEVRTILQAFRRKPLD